MDHEIKHTEYYIALSELILISLILSCRSISVPSVDTEAALFKHSFRRLFSHNPWLTLVSYLIIEASNQHKEIKRAIYFVMAVRRFKVYHYSYIG